MLGYSIEPIMLYQVSERSADVHTLNMIQNTTRKQVLRVRQSLYTAAASIISNNNHQCMF